MPDVIALEDMLIHEIADLVSAEELWTDELPWVLRSASSVELGDAMVARSENLFDRLQAIVRELGMTERQRRSCKAVRGYLGDLRKARQALRRGPDLDREILTSARGVAYYEMSGYTNARSFAQIVGNRTVARLLTETCKEQANALRRLSRLALVPV